MASDISALISELWLWEFAGYVSLAAVAIGVAGEGVHDFTKWFKRSPWWAAKGNKASLLVLVIALAAELIIQVEVNITNGQIIAFLTNDTARLSAEAETARSEIAKANADANKARLETERIRQNNLQLEADLSPRVLDGASVLAKAQVTEVTG